MAERAEGVRAAKTARKRPAPAEARENVAESPEVSRADDDAERMLGRWVGRGLPVVTVLAAIGVGALSSVGSALLVLAAGTLLGTIALLWASVRTLGGDAPLPRDLEAVVARRNDVDALAEQKRRVLRALKDLDAEHALGKIDEADYEALSMQYREQAKALMREMDQNVAPAMAEAEKVAAEYLAKRGLGRDRREESTTTEEISSDGRVACPGCQASNERDAAFCKKCGAAIRAGESTETSGDASS